MRCKFHFLVFHLAYLLCIKAVSINSKAIQFVNVLTALSKTKKHLFQNSTERLQTALLQTYSELIVPNCWMGLHLKVFRTFLSVSLVFFG